MSARIRWVPHQSRIAPIEMRGGEDGLSKIEKRHVEYAFHIVIEKAAAVRLWAWQGTSQPGLKPQPKRPPVAARSDVHGGCVAHLGDSAWLEQLLFRREP